MSAIRGTRVRRGAALLLTALLIPGVAGCSLVEADGSEAPLSGLAACALGHTWSMDLEDAAAQVAASLTGDLIPFTAVTAEGTQTLEWSLEGHVTLKSDYTLTITTAPAADQVLTISQKHSGTSTGRAYINGEVAIPRKWDGTGMNIDTVADNNGTTVEDVPFEIPQTSIDDSVGLELTCDADTLTIHPRSEDVTQKWTRTA